jgi:hypothetical protein
MKRRLRLFLLMVLLLIGLSFCRKEEPIPGDQVLGQTFFLTTNDVIFISCGIAFSGGYIIDNVSGCGVLTTTGVCWSTTLNPTIADNKTIGGIEPHTPYWQSTLPA